MLVVGSSIFITMDIFEIGVVGKVLIMNVDGLKKGRLKKRRSDLWMECVKDNVARIERIS